MKRESHTHQRYLYDRDLPLCDPPSMYITDGNIRAERICIYRYGTLGTNEYWSP